MQILQTAHTIAKHRQWTMLAELFAAVGASLETIPNPGRWGIPDDVVSRDVDEALRWSPVVVHATQLAERLVADARLGDGSAAEAWLEATA